MTLQGHPRSLILAEIESAFGLPIGHQFSSNLVPILLRFRYIRAFVCRKPLFPYPTRIPAESRVYPLIGVDSWCRGSAVCSVFSQWALYCYFASGTERSRLL